MREKTGRGAGKTADKKIDKELEPGDIVKLKPLFGMRPGVYLAALYSFILLCVFFVALVLPGLRRPGAVLEFETEPTPVAVRVNGVFMGTSQERFFVPQGTHTLEFVLPGFNAQSMEVDVPGRVFASRFFPRRLPLQVALATDNPLAAFALSAAEYAAWSFGGEPSETWQIPLSLSEGVYRVAPLSRDAQGHPDLAADLDEMLRAGARFASTRAALRDLTRAKVLLDNYGLSPSPASLFNTAADIISFLSEQPGSAQWLASLLPPEAAALVTESQWYQNEITAPLQGQTLAQPPATGDFMLAGLAFTYFSGGVLVQGQPFPHSINIEGFFFGNEEVSNLAFESFLAANPQWRREEIENLIAQGLVTSEYLADETFASPARITGVSWFAAQAFVQWLNGFLPPAMADWEVRLPTEAEWEYVAKSVRAWPPFFAQRVASMDGAGTWEWSADYFSHLPFFTATDEAVVAIASPERSVRGAVWQWGGSLSAVGDVNIEVRGSLPPETSSAFVSFRPVIARIGDPASSATSP
ncbi:MAG: SUMF1/EgtB/PvdO family nonheme iron enzyme [Spirochaetes bacterium]|nr:SUMF1/EgtB/PvdO family nonheme iron enzyme [Spirochaetota bacterium]